MRAVFQYVLAAFLVLTMGCSGALDAEQLAAAQSRTLVLAVLNVKGSFKKNLQEPADRVHDTLQWWIGPHRQWQIRTYSLDHDIHITEVKKGRDALQSALDYIERQYDDKVHAVHVLTFPNVSSTEQVEQVLAKAGLKPNLNVDSQGFAFWTPDGAKYRPQSQPR